MYMPDELWEAICLAARRESIRQGRRVAAVEVVRQGAAREAAWLNERFEKEAEKDAADE
jgi:hypothetical protein